MDENRTKSHNNKLIWRPISLSVLIPIIFNTELTHLGSVAPIHYVVIQYCRTY